MIGGAIAPILEGLIDFIQPLISGFAAWAEKNQTLVKILGIAVLGIGGLMLVLGPLLLILPQLVAGMALLAGASGIGLVVLAIAAVTAGALFLWKNWQEVWDFIKDATEEAVNFIIDMFNKMTFLHREALAGMLVVAKKFIDALSGGNPLGDAMQKAIDAIRRGVPEIDITIEKTEELAQTWVEASRGIVGSADRAADAVESLGAGIHATAEKVDQASDEIETMAEDLGESTEDIVADLETIRIKFDETAATIVFNASEQGQAWDELGGNVESILNAMAEVSGTTTAQMVDDLIGMRLEGENWKDFLLRLDNEGTINLAHLAEGYDALRDAANLAADLQDAQESFDNATNTMLFNISEQGQAWDELGGDVESILNAMAEVSGTTTTQMVDDLIGMRIEGENWKDFLLRLDNEGTINLAHLAEGYDALRDAANLAADLQDAQESFDNATNTMLFNISEQGQAWDELGGDVESILNAMAEVSGSTTTQIIDDLIGMRLEGENWKDFLLRLDQDGTINLESLAQEFVNLLEIVDNSTQAADQRFDDTTQNLLFNLSDQGAAWRALGGSVDGVLKAMDETSDRTGQEIIDDLIGMRLEGENWKDFLLRLDNEGTINLAHLAEGYDALRDAANLAADAAARPVTGEPTAGPSTIGGLSLQDVQIIGNSATAQIAALMGQPGSELQIQALQRTLRSLPTFDSYKHGGTVPGPASRPQLAIVHGKETITPPGKGGPNVNFYGPVYGFEDFERKVAGIAVRQQRRGALKT